MENIKTTRKEIETLIKISTLRDVELKLRNSQLEKFPPIVPDYIYEVLKELEAEYRKSPFANQAEEDLEIEAARIAKENDL